MKVITENNAGQEYRVFEISKDDIGENVVGNVPAESSFSSNPFMPKKAYSCTSLIEPMPCVVIIRFDGAWKQVNLTIKRGVRNFGDITAVIF